MKSLIGVGHIKTPNYEGWQGKSIKLAFIKSPYGRRVGEIQRNDTLICCSIS